MLEMIAPSEREVWRKEEFSARVKRLSDVSKETLSPNAVEALKDQKRKYWPVMANRNAIAHNPLFFHSFSHGTEAFVSANIYHQQKDTAYELVSVQRFADEADAVSAELMSFVANFSRALKDEIDYRNILLAGMHLRAP